MSAQPLDFSDLGAVPVVPTQAGKLDFSDLGATPVEEERPQVPRPQLEMNYANPLPTENIPIAGAMLQPFGELAANLKYDPAFRNETAKYGAGSAAAVGAVAAAPAVGAAIAPAARVATQAMRAHPILTTLGLEAAKQIPGVGPYVRHIPAWLPLLSWNRRTSISG